MGPTVDRIRRFRETRDRAVEALLSLQREDGHWCAELEGDSILQSEYILMKWILGQEHAPMRDGRDGWETLSRIANHLRDQQRPDGGWGQFPGSGVDLSASVKAYFALKLMGDDPRAGHMVDAVACIRAHGGAERCNSFSNFYLACLGQIPWSAVPAIPPEIVRLPRWFYFHLDKVSAWTRTMILPLALVTTLRPTRSLGEALGIDELFVDQSQRHRLTMREETPRFWGLFFKGVDRVLKLLHEPLSGTRFRRNSIQRSLDWILERAGQDGDAATDGLGAIFPPMVYLQVVLMAHGYSRDHPVVRRAEEELDDFFIEDSPERIRIQPCFSPVWDTGIALYALADCGFTAADEPAARAADWLRSKECRFQGDWIRNVRGSVPFTGWYFEYHNAWYPDCDDTAMVGKALHRIGGEENLAASGRALDWMLAMQNDDGGWAAFDRTESRPILEYVPFADHNAMQDPSCTDITGRALEFLHWQGLDTTHPAVRSGIEFIKRSQEPQGCFFGRWGVNYIYGTWQSIVGPIMCGADPSEDWLQRAGAWLRSVQKPDGSFGESANSYEDPSRMGQGPSTASQTAWGAMAMLAVHGPEDEAVLRALEWLSDNQLDEAAAADPSSNPDGDPAGSWCETEFTGTGFPKVFYLRYHLYRLYFPAMALGRFVSAVERTGNDGAMESTQTLSTP
ncbi:MAG: squalene--hopene cyclase [Planctomycetota bacterium]|nr:squalene--hopene cyclase [Planctomycetota bacterium]MEC9234253.1 squalene--hopene cyclase [Planctomycetota bacterium]